MIGATGIKQERILCDCCGTETLAIQEDDTLVIKGKRHGQRHVVRLALDKLLEKCKGGK